MKLVENKPPLTHYQWGRGVADELIDNMNFFCRRLSTLLHTGILPRFPPTDDLRTTTCQYPSVFFCRRSPKFPFNDVFPKLPSTDVFPRTFCQAPHIFFSGELFSKFLSTDVLLNFQTNVVFTGTFHCLFEK